MATKPSNPFGPSMASAAAAQPRPCADPIPLRSFAPATRRRVISDTTGPSLTRQEFKAECDINNILASFQRTGAMHHFAKYAPEYGEFNACDLQQAQNLLIRARQMFDDLPSSVKREVSTPEGFLSFVQDPANAEKMAALGLTNPRATPVPPASPSEGA